MKRILIIYVSILAIVLLGLALSQFARDKGLVLFVAFCFALGVLLTPVLFPIMAISEGFEALKRTLRARMTERDEKATSLP